MIGCFGSGLTAKWDVCLHIFLYVIKYRLFLLFWSPGCNSGKHCLSYSLWTVVLWKFHEFLVRNVNPWKSFHGPWILQDENSWGYFKPLIFRELGEFFSWPMNFFKSLLSWPMNLFKSTFMTHEFLLLYFHDPWISFSLLSRPINFPWESPEWIPWPMNFFKAYFHDPLITLKSTFIT